PNRAFVEFRKEFRAEFRRQAEAEGQGEQAAGISQARLGAAKPCAGGVSAGSALAADLNELVDGGNGVVTAVPKAVAQGRAAGMVVHVDLGRAERGGRLGKLASDEALGGSEVHVTFGRQKVPIAEK